MQCAASPEASLPAAPQTDTTPGEDSSSAQAQNPTPESQPSSEADAAAATEIEASLEGTRTAQLATLAEQADIRWSNFLQLSSQQMPCFE